MTREKRLRLAAQAVVLAADEATRFDPENPHWVKISREPLDRLRQVIKFSEDQELLRKQNRTEGFV